MLLNRTHWIYPGDRQLLLYTIYYYTLSMAFLLSTALPSVFNDTFIGVAKESFIGTRFNTVFCTQISTTVPVYTWTWSIYWKYLTFCHPFASLCTQVTKTCQRIAMNNVTIYVYGAIVAQNCQKKHILRYMITFLPLRGNAVPCMG